MQELYAKVARTAAVHRTQAAWHLTTLIDQVSEARAGRSAGLGDIRFYLDLALGRIDRAQTPSL